MSSEPMPIAKNQSLQYSQVEYYSSLPCGKNLSTSMFLDPSIGDKIDALFRSIDFDYESDFSRRHCRQIFIGLHRYNPIYS